MFNTVVLKVKALAAHKAFMQGKTDEVKAFTVSLEQAASVGHQLLLSVGDWRTSGPATQSRDAGANGSCE
eukprot:6239761-Amphidinium_carterae.2